MKKTIGFICALILAGSVAIAGDMYANKSYVPVVTNAAIGVSMQGATTTAVVVSTPTVSNATGVACSGYPGSGAMMLSINCGDSGNGVIAASVWTTTNAGTASAYTNGTWSTSSNAITSVTYTNVSARYVFPWVPNRELGYVQVRFAATTVTNGNVGASFVAESK